MMKFVPNEEMSTEDIPYIVLMIPYEPGMRNKARFDLVVNNAVLNAKKQLLLTYPDQTAKPIIDKLHHLLEDIDPAKHKSISIMVSPMVEKILYFDYERVQWERYKIA